MQLLIGIVLILFGEVAVFTPLPVISAIAYPILWWGFLIALDAVNYRRWHSSLMRNYLGTFLGIIVPLSVLYWLSFELVNVAYPQWLYLGAIPATLPGRLLLTVTSFATVIPAIIEILWFFSGPIVPARSPGSFRVTQRSLLFVALGIIAAVIPFFSTHFILNQTIWLAPFFLFFPFIKTHNDSYRTKHGGIGMWLGAIALAGLLSGLLWEYFNFWADSKWIYVILKDAPHLFEMPIYGYLGFIPFAFSTVGVYLFGWYLKLWRPRTAPLFLYILTISASLLFALNS